MDDQAPSNTPTPPLLNVVLFQPEIPQNTGNIGRTCVALQCKLWIVRPTGFRLDDAHLKRAGLDYWQFLDWEAVDDWDQLAQKLPTQRYWFFTKFAKKSYTDFSYRAGDVLVFGSETNGLPESIRNAFQDRCVSLPMTGPVRSLNLAVSVGIGVYEAYRSIQVSSGSGLASNSR